MNTSKAKKPEREGSFASSLLAFLVCVAIILVGVIYMKLAVEIPLALAVMAVCFYGKFYLHIDYPDMEKSMVRSLSDALGVMLLLLTIGPLMASWIACGTVPYIIYLGLGMISPSWYLAFIVLMCAILSTVTGSSWTTMGTIGVAFIGISIGMHISLPLTAGAILCGAYFGDKISPVSDMVVFNTGIAKVDIMHHCKNLLYTTVPALCCSILVFFILGMRYRNEALDASDINAIRDGLAAQYNFNPLLWLPLIAVIVAIVLKVPAVPALWSGVAVAALLALPMHACSATDFLGYLFNGYSVNTGSADIDSILNRGGMVAMFNIIAVVVCSMSFGGVLDRTKILIKVAEKLANLTKGKVGLIVTTLFTGIVSSFVASDPYIAALIPVKAFENEYEKRGLDKTMLSRTVSDGGICYAPIVPWGSNGVFVSTTLGLATGSFWMFYFMAFFTPLFTLICAITGFGIENSDGTKGRKHKKPKRMAEAEAEAEADA